LPGFELPAKGSQPDHVWQVDWEFDIIASSYSNPLTQNEINVVTNRPIINNLPLPPSDTKAE